ncbi:MAG: phosphatidylserine/phosphatidylglycerophosphate/cardiolipin synthase family protein [Gemmatimonadaceae bacterium]|nr:phosphatidylserine/phosphatidylglycerophosphate/cardiolipin synthase family protein [Gemmatimonadaceae bacterium]
MSAITTPATPITPATLAPVSSTIGPQFARGLWRIAAADASSGNAVELMRDGTQIFAAMLEMIEQAKESVMLESYIVNSDSVGERFAEALIAAAARGVQVRLIADWVGSWTTKRAFWRKLRDGKVDVRIFNRPGFKAWLGAVPRDHRKLLAVDQRVALTGGIGLSEEWSGIVKRRHKAPWRDTAVRIEGPAAVDFSRAFEDMWKRANREERRAARRHALPRARNTGVLPEQSAGAVVGVIEGEPWRLRVARALQIQAVSAERAIWIASAYFYPSSAEMEALCGAALDSVDVRVLVPSRYDHPWVRRFARSVYRQLLRNGVRIWEWNGIMMHAKTSVVDGRWVRVGSTDFNPLGVAINYELDAVIESQVLGKAAEEMFLRDLEESTEIKNV